LTDRWQAKNEKDADGERGKKEREQKARQLIGGARIGAEERSGMVPQPFL